MIENLKRFRKFGARQRKFVRKFAERDIRFIFFAIRLCMWAFDGKFQKLVFSNQISPWTPTRLEAFVTTLHRCQTPFLIILFIGYSTLKKNCLLIKLQNKKKKKMT